MVRYVFLGNEVYFRNPNRRHVRYERSGHIMVSNGAHLMVPTQLWVKLNACYRYNKRVKKLNRLF
jgi:hypothetical protein